MKNKTEPKGIDTNPSALSPRELETAKRLAEGATNREIAVELGISVKTIDTHRGHVLVKLGLRNNADIARWAIYHAVIELPVRAPDAALATPMVGGAASMFDTSDVREVAQ